MSIDAATPFATEKSSDGALTSLLVGWPESGSAGNKGNKGTKEVLLFTKDEMVYWFIGLLSSCEMRFY